EGDLAADRSFLFGHVDDTHAALADLLQELVRSDNRAGTFADRLIDGGDVPHSRPLSPQGRGEPSSGRFQETAGTGPGFEQGFHLAAQRRISGAGPVQVLLTRAGGAQLQGLQEQIVRSGVPGWHGLYPMRLQRSLSLRARNQDSLRAKKGER